VSSTWVRRCTAKAARAQILFEIPIYPFNKERLAIICVDETLASRGWNYAPVARALIFHADRRRPS
jgi:hypothetical protein